MAISEQNKNFVLGCMKDANDILEVRDRLIDKVARWNLNDISNQLTDQDLLDIPSLSHLSKSEIVSCITAFQAVLTALGDDVSGQATNLIKMKG